MLKVFLVVALLVGVSCRNCIASDQPNLVVILADDLGLGDISFHVRTILKKKPLVETSTLDSLASQSLWFTDGHSATAFCAPSRYAIMSGNGLPWKS